MFCSKFKSKLCNSLQRTYLPDKVSHVLSLWKAELGKINEKAGQSLADPQQYENLFPGFQEALKTQRFIAQHEPELLPAHSATKIPMNIDRDASEEMKSNENQESFQYSELDKPESVEDLVENIQLIDLDEAPPAINLQPERSNSIEGFDFDEEIEEDTLDINVGDEDELLSDESV